MRLRHEGVPGTWFLFTYGLVCVCSHVAAGFERQNKRQGIKVLEHNYFHVIVLPRHKTRPRQVGEQTALAHELKKVGIECKV